MKLGIVFQSLKIESHHSTHTKKEYEWLVEEKEEEEVVNEEQIPRRNAIKIETFWLNGNSTGICACQFADEKWTPHTQLRFSRHFGFFFFFSKWALNIII